jgi:hypothetical protein
MFYLQLFNTILFVVLIYSALAMPGKVLRGAGELSLAPEEEHPVSVEQKKRCVLCGVSEILAGELRPALGERCLCWACRQEIVEQEGFAGEVSPGIKAPAIPSSVE